MIGYDSKIFILTPYDPDIRKIIELNSPIEVRVKQIYEEMRKAYREGYEIGIKEALEPKGRMF